MDFEKLNQGPKGSLLIVDMIFSALAVLLSCIALDGIRKSRFDLAGYRCFLISYTISDIFTASINLLRFIYTTVYYQTDVDIACCGSFLRSLQLAGLCANLLSLLAMSTDHFFAIVYTSRYDKFMTRRITGAAIFVIWIFSFISGFIDVPIATVIYLTRDPNAYLAMNVGFSFPIKDAAAFLPPKVDTFDKDPSPLIAILKQPLLADKWTAGGFGMVDISESPVVTINDSFSSSSSDNNVLGLFVLLKSIQQISSPPLDVEQYLYEETQRMVRQRRIEPDWCSFFMSTQSMVEFLVLGLTLTCFVFIVFCYGRILKKVLDNTDHSLRDRVTQVLTTCVLLGAFIISRIPFVAFEFTMNLMSDPSVPIPIPMSPIFFKIHNVLDTVFISYPLIDALICIVRIRVVRRFVYKKYFSLPACCKAFIRRNFYAGGQSLATISQRHSSNIARPSTSSSHALITPSHSSSERWCHTNSNMINVNQNNNNSHQNISKERHSSSNNSDGGGSQIIAVTIPKPPHH